MRLIDVLNLIAKGELEEGTKIKLILDREGYTYKRSPMDVGKHDLYNEDGESLFDNYFLEVLNDEVEITGHIDEPDKKAEKIEELTCSLGFSTPREKTIVYKLNEVIRELNKRSE